ncbi:MAG: enoyl-CoA hydratase-related protein [Acidobacteriota bacterium]
MFDNLKLEIEEGIALLTVNRPETLNALNRETMKELEAAFAQLREDAAAGAVIVTGEGPKSFVAGADIKELEALDAAAGKKLSAQGQAIFRAIETFPKLVIAAVNGYCLGGGCELALACHLRIASETAVFGQPEVQLGLVPGYGGTQRLGRLVGKGLALEMILCGQMVDAGRALRMGLVNRVVEPAQLMNESRAVASRILQNGPLAVQYSIEAIDRGLQMPLEEGLSLESTLFGLACASQDMKEGTRAFLEKRNPQFEGR